MATGSHSWVHGSGSCLGSEVSLSQVGLGLEAVGNRRGADSFGGSRQEQVKHITNGHKCNEGTNETLWQSLSGRSHVQKVV